MRSMCCASPEEALSVRASISFRADTLMSVLPLAVNFTNDRMKRPGSERASNSCEEDLYATGSFPSTRLVSWVRLIVHRIFIHR